MRLLMYLGWLLGCCYAVARVPRMVARAVARVPRLVARVLGVVARAVARVPRMVAIRLLGFPGWLLWVCYVVAGVLGVVARVLLSGC